MRTLDSLFVLSEVAAVLGIKANTLRMWRTDRFSEFFEGFTGHHKFRPIDVCRLAVALALADVGFSHEEAFKIALRGDGARGEKLSNHLVKLCQGSADDRLFFISPRGGYPKLDAALSRFVAAAQFVYEREGETSEAEVWSARDEIGEGVVHTVVKIDVTAVVRITLMRLLGGADE
ncbi:helix-turn-helix domain-containing protein [Mesorhizobium sp. M1423]|uniref:MerR family transcriptional regulator n=1 Tax=Mesorhizobium sp. M1423 TaxID=2957101 RepID=UPI003338DB5D